MMNQATFLDYHLVYLDLLISPLYPIISLIFIARFMTDISSPVPTLIRLSLTFPHILSSTYVFQYLNAELNYTSQKINQKILDLYLV